MVEDIARIGDWVQIEKTILEAGSRAPGVPDDTAALPMTARIKGFALSEGGTGDEIEIETVIGRRIVGRLVVVEPRHGHDFGGPIKELTAAGIEARDMISGREES